MNQDDVKNWLRKEAEDIQKDIDKVEKKIRKIIKSEDLNSLDKINQYNIQRNELKSAMLKLYEMIGRIDEIKEE